MSESESTTVPQSPYVHYLNAVCRLMDGNSQDVAADWAVVEKQFEQWSKDSDTHAIMGLGEEGILAKGVARGYREILVSINGARQELARLSAPPEQPAGPPL